MCVCGSVLCEKGCYGTSLALIAQTSKLISSAVTSYSPDVLSIRHVRKIILEKEKDRQREAFSLSEAGKCLIGPTELSGRMAPLMRRTATIS